LGINIIGDAGWGTHLCLFYRSKEDLVDILVPYFKAGLENNEFCMWVTSEPVKVEDAKTALKKVVKDLDNYIERGQIEILDYTQWYIKEGRKLDLDKVLQGWVEKEKQALKRGFDGIRVTGNTYWLERSDWSKFMDYEAVVNSAIGEYRMLAICSYSLDKCGASEVIDVVNNHQFALTKREGTWEVIESAERKRAEEALRKSEERHHTLVESINDIVFTLDREGKFTYLSPRFEVATGYLPEDLIGHSFTEVLAPEYIESTVDRFRRGLSGETIPLYEVELLLRDGRRLPIELNVTTILDAEGQPSGRLGVARDITERKQAEEALKRSEKKYRDLFNNANDLIQVINQAGEFLAVNPKWLETLEYTEEEVKGMRVTDIIRADKIAQIGGLMQNVKEGESISFETVFISKSGKEIDVEGHGNGIFKDGKFISYFGIFRDITERKRAEEREREAVAAAAAAQTAIDTIEAIGDGLIIHTRDGKMTFVNPAFEKMTGYEKSELAGKDAADVIQEVVKPENREKTMGIMGAALVGGKVPPVRRAITLISKEGREVPVIYTVSFIQDAEGKPTSVVVVFKDITEFKRAEEELRAKEMQLIHSGRLASLGEMATAIAHEMNQPLSIISMAAEGVLRAIEKNRVDMREIPNDLDDILKSVKRIDRIITHTRTYARKLEEIRAVEPEEVLNNAFILLDAQFRSHNISVSHEIESNLPAITVDPNQLEQVFVNILTNARQALDERGEEVEKKGESFEKRLVCEVSREKKEGKDYVVYEFADNGYGVPEDQKRRIFEPFFTTKEAGEGTGLGLSIVYDIVTRSLGGDIRVEDNDMGGASFKVALPVKDKTTETQRREGL